MELSGNSLRLEQIQVRGLSMMEGVALADVLGIPLMSVDFSFLYGLSRLLTWSGFSFSLNQVVSLVLNILHYYYKRTGICSKVFLSQLIDIMYLRIKT